MNLCTELLSVLVDSADWLLIFNSNGEYRHVCSLLILDIMLSPAAYSPIIAIDFVSYVGNCCALEQGVYQTVTMVTSDEFTRLMPWAFYR